MSRIKSDVEVDKGSIVAQCYLSESTDDSEVSYLTPFWFYIILNKKSWRFDNQNIKNIRIDHYRLVGSLIVGGLMSCFSIIFLSADYLDPVLLLTLFVLGVALLYYGWTGSAVIVVTEVNDSTTIYLKEIPESFKEYLKFFKNYQFRKNQIMHIYHIATIEDWNKDPVSYRHSSLEIEKFIHASTKEQVLPAFQIHFPEKGDFILLEIDIVKLNCELKYELSADREQSFPHIYGEIPKNAVSNTYLFKERKNLSDIMFRL